MVIALVTDSSSQLTPELASLTGARVVPVTVEIDGKAFTEGVDLDADGFFELFRPGESVVTSAQPSPARFLKTYEACVASGATEIVCVLVGSAYSGTIDSARLAAANIDAPVHIVDSGMASFGISCCVLATAEALGNGASLGEALAVAESTAEVVESVFLLQGLELAKSGGRYEGAELPEDGAPILRAGRESLDVVASVHDLDEAVNVMAAAVVSTGQAVRVASGLADRATLPLSTALVDRLSTEELVTSIVHYRVGPSVAAHTGPGTAGVFFWPS